MRFCVYLLIVEILVCPLVWSTDVQINFKRNQLSNTVGSLLKPIDNDALDESVKNLSNLVKSQPNTILVYTEMIVQIFPQKSQAVARNLADKTLRTLHTFMAKILDVVDAFQNSLEHKDLGDFKGPTQRANKNSVHILYEVINDATIVWNISTNSFVNVVDLIAKTQFSIKNESLCLENVQIKAEKIFTENFIIYLESYFDSSTASVNELMGIIIAFRNEKESKIQHKYSFLITRLARSLSNRMKSLEHRISKLDKTIFNEINGIVPSIAECKQISLDDLPTTVLFEASSGQQIGSVLSGNDTFEVNLPQQDKAEVNFDIVGEHLVHINLTADQESIDKYIEEINRGIGARKAGEVRKNSALNSTNVIGKRFAQVIGSIRMTFSDWIERFRTTARSLISTFKNSSTAAVKNLRNEESTASGNASSVATTSSTSVNLFPSGLSSIDAKQNISSKIDNEANHQKAIYTKNLTDRTTASTNNGSAASIIASVENVMSEANSTAALLPQSIASALPSNGTNEGPDNILRATGIKQNDVIKSQAENAMISANTSNNRPNNVTSILPTHHTNLNNASNENSTMTSANNSSAASIIASVNTVSSEASFLASLLAQATSSVLSSFGISSNIPPSKDKLSTISIGTGNESSSSTNIETSTTTTIASTTTSTPTTTTTAFMTKIQQTTTTAKSIISRIVNLFG